MIVYCTECGQKIDERTIYCPRCGKLSKRARQTKDAVIKAQAGDQNAITWLYNDTFPYFMSVCKYTMGDNYKTEDAEDVLQSVYIKLFRSLNNLKEPEKFQAWGKIAVIRAVRDHLSGKKAILVEDEMLIDYLDSDPETDKCVYDPQLIQDKKETSRIVQEILDVLPSDQKLCIYLFYMEDLSVKDIAAQMAVSENTVKSRLNYGRKKVKEKVQEYEKNGAKLYSAGPVVFFLCAFKVYLDDEIAQAAINPNLLAGIRVQLKLPDIPQKGIHVSKNGLTKIKPALKAITGEGTKYLPKVGRTISGIVMAKPKLSLLLLSLIISVPVSVKLLMPSSESSRAKNASNDKLTQVLLLYDQCLEKKAAEKQRQADALVASGDYYPDAYIFQPLVFALGYMDGDDLPDLFVGYDMSNLEDMSEYEQNAIYGLEIYSCAYGRADMISVVDTNISVSYFEGKSILRAYLPYGPIDTRDFYMLCQKEDFPGRDMSMDEVTAIIGDQKHLFPTFYENTKDNRQKYLNIDMLGSNQHLVKADVLEDPQEDAAKKPQKDAQEADAKKGHGIFEGVYGEYSRLWVRKNGDRYDVSFIAYRRGGINAYGYVQNDRLVLTDFRTNTPAMAEIIWDSPDQCTVRFLKDIQFAHAGMEFPLSLVKDTSPEDYVWSDFENAADRVLATFDGGTDH